LGWFGWRGGVKRGRGLGFARPVRWRVVDGRGGSVGNTMRSEAGKQGEDVARVGDRESTVGAIVGEGKAEKGRSDWVGFDVI
jgi:hypothetical protein